MKKIRSVKMLVIGLIVGILLSSATAFAATAISTATFNSTKVVFNGNDLDLAMPLISVITADNPEFASNYMPVRTVLEAMGYVVDWDGANNAVLVSSPEITNDWTNSPDNKTVWIANSTSLIAHSSSICSNMSIPIQTTKGEVVADSGRACQQCWVNR